MAILPDKLDNYRKFFTFIVKYWNSDVVQSTTSSIGIENQSESNDEYNDSPQELVKDLKEMGPTYVKLGQLLSTRPDLLPDSYLEQLSQLQDDVETIPYSKIQEIFKMR